MLVLQPLTIFINLLDTKCRLELFRFAIEGRNDLIIIIIILYLIVIIFQVVSLEFIDIRLVDGHEAPVSRLAGPELLDDEPPRRNFLKIVVAAAAVAGLFL